MTVGQIKTSLNHFGSNILRDFFKSNFEIVSTKRSKIIGAALTAALLLCVVLNVDAYTSQSFSGKWLLLGFCLCAPFIVGATAAFGIRIKREIVNKIWHYVFLLLMPIVTITMTECLNDIFVYNMTYLGFLGNYITTLLLYFLVYTLSGSLRLPILIVNPVLFGLALAHSYLMDFRGTPFLPMDFLSVTTAAGVANTYHYSLTYKVTTAIILFAFIIVIGVRVKTPKYALISKIISRVFAGTFFTVLIVLFYFTSVFADMGVKPDFWNQNRGYRNYGFTFNFVCNTKYLYMSVPNGYDPNDLKGFVDSVVPPEDNQQPTIVPDSSAPNIICIMNESLADFSLIGNLTTNEDYMPFIHSLSENTVKGKLYVPVIGAGTSNTEFEFLTGHTTAFLPSGSNAYMLYIKNPIASLVSTLKGQGYSAFTFHPYYRNGWNRVNVYQNLGFNSFKSLEDVMDVSLMNQYIENGNDPNFLQSLIDEVYPDSNMLIRQYVSDSYDYKVLIDDFENRDKNIPYFAFNVTMQNHGGYTTSSDNFNESIFATSTTKSYNKANKYLSLVRASDTAFEELISYFSGVDEPTVICMFGDHQPSLETEFIAEVLGVPNLSSLSIELEQERHATPFVIWANYDIEEQQIEKISSNYLSSLVLKTAGVRQTEYNKYLLKLYESLPVINTVGYIDRDNNYYRWSDTSPYSGLLSEYEKIQYNNIFDKNNKENAIFNLDGYIPTATDFSGEKEGEE